MSTVSPSRAARSPRRVGGATFTTTSAPHGSPICAPASRERGVREHRALPRAGLHDDLQIARGQLADHVGDEPDAPLTFSRLLRNADPHAARHAIDDSARPGTADAALVVDGERVPVVSVASSRVAGGSLDAGIVGSRHEPHGAAILDPGRGDEAGARAERRRPAARWRRAPPGSGRRRRTARRRRSPAGPRSTRTTGSARVARSCAPRPDEDADRLVVAPGVDPAARGDDARGRRAASRDRVARGALDGVGALDPRRASACRRCRGRTARGTRRRRPAPPAVPRGSGRSSQTRSPGRTFASTAFAHAHAVDEEAPVARDAVDRRDRPGAGLRLGDAAQDVEKRRRAAVTPTGGDDTTGCAPKSRVTATDTVPVDPPAASPHPISTTATRTGRADRRERRASTGTRPSLPQCISRAGEPHPHLHAPRRRRARPTSAT